MPRHPLPARRRHPPTGAGLDTADLQIVALADYGWRASLRYGVALVLGRLSSLRDVTVARDGTVDIHGPVSDPVQLDGDAVTTVPAHIVLASRMVSFVVPAAT